MELALKAKPNDPELLKLKEDLEEVIKLTASLIGCDLSILNSDEPAAAAASSSYSNEANISASSQSNNQAASSTTRSAIKWKTGDRCLAPWIDDGK